MTKKININNKKVFKYNRKSLKKNIKRKTIKKIQKGGNKSICKLFSEPTPETTPKPTTHKPTTHKPETTPKPKPETTPKPKPKPETTSNPDPTIAKANNRTGLLNSIKKFQSSNLKQPPKSNTKSTNTKNTLEQALKKRQKAYNPLNSNQENSWSSNNNS